MKDSIKAWDIRKGNSIEMRGKIWRIEEIMFDNVRVAREIGENVYDEEIAPYEDLSPIPLSKEVLEKCGFTPSQIGHYIDIENTEIRLRRLFVKNDGGKYWLVYADVLLEWKDDRDRITLSYDLKNLHTLQNWYNLLSGGKELEITL